MPKLKLQNCRLSYLKARLKDSDFSPTRWLDIKKCKSLLRKITYSAAIQSLVCNLIVIYLHFVYFTSRVRFVNFDVFANLLQSRSPLILAIWHNRLLLSPFFAHKAKKELPQAKFIALVSRHGDGRFIGKISEKMGAKAIYGSTKNGRKASRGIDFASMRELIKNLRDGYCLGITPDGPRGPAMQINGNLLHIAQISSAKILSVSVSSNKSFEVNSWDKMKIPLPFGKICFFVHDSAIEVPSNANQGEMKVLQEIVRIQLNEDQELSDKFLL